MDIEAGISVEKEYVNIQLSIFLFIFVSHHDNVYLYNTHGHSHGSTSLKSLRRVKGRVSCLENKSAADNGAAPKVVASEFAVSVGKFRAKWLCKGMM